VTRAVAVALASLCALAGCGLGPGDAKKGGAELRVTRDFGRVTLTTARMAALRPSDTVMRFLQSHAKVTTRYGGGFVQSIDGVQGQGSGGRHDWFYFVNGVEAPRGAGDRALNPGDVVQWDYRRWDASPRAPAIVGAFPEPFLHGDDGKRLPTRIECAARGDSCRAVEKAFADVGVPAGVGVPGATAEGKVLRVAVGTWSELRRISSLNVLQGDPAGSGVFARFDRTGTKLSLLDEAGRAVRDAPAGSGLVAAVLPAGQKPYWIVTGLDDAGVARAAALISPSSLRNAYAVAATPAGAVRLPVPGGRG
jgi:hypothetical protein